MDKSIDPNSPAVQSYLAILQDIIGRMSSNSASAKTWCIALVSATIVVIADKAVSEYVWIALVPVCLFFLLDAFYLGLERQFRKQYNSFIIKLHEGKAQIADIFIVSSGGDHAESLGATIAACGSISVWPFYSLLALMLLAVHACII